MFLQQLFNGLSVGSIYALMAVGYSLIYSLLNFTNFAHSLTVTLGAFVAFFVTSTALQNLTVGILAAVAVAGAAAMLIQKTAYSPLLKKNVRRIYLTIVVEQNAKKILTIANRAYVMEQGRIVKSGSGQELASDSSIVEAYLGGRRGK